MLQQALPLAPLCSPFLVVVEHVTTVNSPTTSTSTMPTMSDMGFPPQSCQCHNSNWADCSRQTTTIAVAVAVYQKNQSFTVQSSRHLRHRNQSLLSPMFSLLQWELQRQIDDATATTKTGGMLCTRTRISNIKCVLGQH